LVFTDEFVGLMANEFAEDRTPGPHRLALDACLARLDPKSREVLLARYGGEITVGSLAGKHRVSVHHLYRLLDQARASLVTCIRRHLHLGGDSHSS
jgi:DNA-directed RNA polymerase specialized sigma24 family protein